MIQLQIENNTVCNAKCGFCPYLTSLRPKTFMPMDLYRRIVDEAAGIEKITTFCITGLGEPTLDPHLDERVRYAREKKPGVSIEVYTNGVYMTPALISRLQGAGLSCVTYSLNAVTPKQHEALMGLKGKFETVVANIDYALASRDGNGSGNSMHVEVHATISNDTWTVANVEAFYKRWGCRDNGDGGHGVVVREGNWAGVNRTTRIFDPNKGCFRALASIYVMVDGRVATCCFDPTGRQVFGDLTKQTLREVYSSKAYVAFRKTHFKDRADKTDICRNCTRI